MNRNGRGLDLRGVVMGWTLFTTTFTWTPTMRMFLKPEVSNWSLFGLSGSGREGAYWVFPVAACAALLLFYLEGRGRLRPLVWVLLLAWHLPVTAAFAYGAAAAGPEARFVGAAWGWEVPLWILSMPFLLFSGLVVLRITQEARGASTVPVAGWLDLDWWALVGALLLLPVAVLFFALGGSGYDGLVRTAIAATVVQWILLGVGLNGHSKARVTNPESVTSAGAWMA